MNELHAAQERIVKLEQELAVVKEQNHGLQEMLISYVEVDTPPISQEGYEEILRNPFPESITDSIREFERSF